MDGKFLSLGVAVGITENEDVAAKAMGNMISNIRSKVNDFKILMPDMLSDSTVTMNSTSEMKLSSFDTTNDLLRGILNRDQVVVLDTGEVVGHTKDLFNTAFGEDIQNKSRWS